MKNRHLLRVAAARFISRAGGEAAFFVGVWGKAAFELRADSAQIALLMAVMSISTIVGTVLSGVLIDRFDARRVLIGAELFFVPVALSFLFPAGMAQMTLLAGLLGFFSAPVMTAAGSMAPFLADENTSVDTVNAWIEGAGSVSFVIGPAAGAVLASLVGIQAIWVFDAVTSLIAVFLVASVKLRPVRRDSAEKPHPLAELWEGLRYTYGQRSLRYPIIIGSVAWLGFGAFSALEPLFFRDILKTGVAAIGWMNALFGVGMVTGAWLSTRIPERWYNARGLALVAATVGLGALAYVGTDLIVVVAVGALAWGLVIGVMDVMLRTLIQASSPDHLVGRITGASHMHRQAGELVPLAAAPALAAAFGVQLVLIGGGLFMSAVSLLSLPEAAAVDRVPRLRTPRRTATVLADEEPLSPNP